MISYRFALKFVLVKHKLTHSLEKNFVCDICAKSFSSKCNLQSHMVHHLPATSPRVQCPICQLWYKNTDTLRTHMHRHRDQRRHVCDTCQKECTTRSALAAHVRYVHLKVQQFECNICQKQFRRRLELIEHKARHTGETLYKCPFCPKTFASNSNYFSHRKNRHPTQFALVSRDSKLKSAEQPLAPQ